MKKTLIALMVLLAVLAAACGDDTETSVGSDDPTDDGTVVDGPTNDDSNADDSNADSNADDDPIDDQPADGPGDDVPLGAGPYPIADLTVTYQLGEDDDPVTYRVACLGDTATVTGDDAPASADQICLALNDEAVRDRVLHGQPTDVACTEQYGGPQVASLVGTLDGEDVDTTVDRANGCGIGDWTLLGDFLPSVG
ncbi:MAG: hypothetical protein DHS20C19_06990 [Acidimicrobiales bacterium]|nr:MAG: hypothetical protein DHS20C19_06990 [Acidimicrobiales bacterium]